MDTNSDQTLRELLLDPALHEPPVEQRHGEAVQRRVLDTRGHEQPHVLVNLFVQRDDILLDYDLAVERAQAWAGTARFSFNAMLVGPEYKNKLRLTAGKLERIVHFLTAPGAKSREKDRADAQVKHQSRKWLYDGGVLYRKDSRSGHLRRHISAEEVFDILTAEHLRSTHHGRDKMLKVLEAKYIGYTKDELMFVIDHCLVCSSKQIRGAAARRRVKRQIGDLENGNVEQGPNAMTSTGISQRHQDAEK